MAKRCIEVPDDHGDEDRISDLPDGIRCHILSFLGTKDAVATTILSTKWMNLWTTALTNVDFDDGKTCGIKFAQIVDKVLHSHNLPIIKSFSINCYQISVYDIHSWVNMVILKKVQDLCLTIENDVISHEYDAPIKLPTSLFICESLEELTLYGPFSVRMIGSCSLPKLKTLRLLKVEYQNDESAHMLISSCPSLELLDIYRYRFDGVENFIIRSSATLKRLLIDHFVDDESYHPYVINVSGLRQLELSELPVHGVLIEDLSSLVNTDISFWEDSEIRLHVDILSLLQGISNSKNLKISIPEYQSRIPAHLFPKFDRLSTLEVVMYCCNWHSLQEFIKNSDSLESLKFTKYICEKTKHLISWRWNPKSVPICLLSSLKTMTFLGFEGLKDELRMVEYILKNAKVMQKMEIEFNYSLRNSKSKPQLR